MLIKDYPNISKSQDDKLYEMFDPSMTSLNFQQIKLIALSNLNQIINFISQISIESNKVIQCYQNSSQSLYNVKLTN